MNLEINISKTMDKENEGNEEFEHRIIRVPEKLRQKRDLQLGEFLRLRNRQGEIETLQIAAAFKEDIAENEDCAYVTTDVGQKLFMLNRGLGAIERAKNITLGCDPEAFLVDRQTGHIVFAHRLMRKYGDVGNDGALIEFRPSPSTTAEIVCDNIWQLIKKARAMLNKVQGGNYSAILGYSSYQGLTAGFHLHYGLPNGLLGTGVDKKLVGSIMTTAFDYYVGIPSIIPEGNTDVDRRTAKYVSYGKPGDFRLDYKTFEFRMPGAKNLAHPLLTRGLMALGAVVAEDVASRIKTCTDDFTNMREIVGQGAINELYPNIPDIHTFYGTVCNPDITAAKRQFEIVKRDVRKMVGYKQREHAVESYFDCINRGIPQGNDIEQNWEGFYNA